MLVLFRKGSVMKYIVIGDFGYSQWVAEFNSKIEAEEFVFCAFVQNRIFANDKETLTITQIALSIELNTFYEANGLKLMIVPVNNYTLQYEGGNT
jgi:hypothetical protein